MDDLNHWLGALPHRHKIVIAGNHDWAFQETSGLAQEALTNATYLQDSMGFQCRNVGCKELLNRIHELSLKAHVFGHIHEGSGECVHGSTKLVNASTCTERYRPTNPPIVLDLDQL